jgi:hypothetical protein
VSKKADLQLPSDVENTHKAFLHPRDTQIRKYTFQGLPLLIKKKKESNAANVIATIIIL